MYSLKWNQDPAPRLHYSFLASPPLSLHALPSLISNCLNLPFQTQEGHGGWSLFLTDKEQGTQNLDSQETDCL